jgi:hypothetical protein
LRFNIVEALKPATAPCPLSRADAIELEFQGDRRGHALQREFSAQDVIIAVILEFGFTCFVPDL